MRLLVVAALYVLFNACAPESLEELPDAGPSETVAAAVCSPDPQRLNGVIGCQLDEQCPCGAHCGQGLCIYECLDGAEPCDEGQRCNLFGRCVDLAPDQQAHAVGEFEQDITPPQAEPIGTFRLKQRRFSTTTDERLIRLYFKVSDAPIPALRFGAAEAIDADGAVLDDGPQVNCVDSDEAGFAPTCLLENLAVGEGREVFMRLSPDAARWRIQAESDRQRDAVIVERVALPPQPVAQELSGQYNGTVAVSDAAGRVLFELPVEAEVLASDEGPKVRIADPLRMLSVDGELWGQEVDGRFRFFWRRMVGSGAQAIGDTEVHLGLLSDEALRHGAGGWLGGRFDFRVAGWMPRDNALLCAGVQAVCAGGQRDPCCGQTSNTTDAHALAVSLGQADLRLFRRADLDGGARVHAFAEHAADHAMAFANMKQRVISRNARSPWVGAVSDLLAIDQVNPVRDSRAQRWRLLEDDALDLMRCESEGLAASHACRGANQGGWGRGEGLAVCAAAEAEALADNCQRFQQFHCSGGASFANCVNECTQFSEDGPGAFVANGAEADGLRIAQAERCAQLYLCYEPPQNETFSTESTELGQRVLSNSGDLTCATQDGGRVPSSLGLFVNSDLEGGGRDPISAGDMLEACYADLARSVPNLDGLGPVWSGRDIRRVFASEGCIDLARFHMALRWTSTPATWMAIDPRTRDESPRQLRSDALYQRLLAQWLQLHQFLARENLQSHRMAQVIRRGDDQISPTAVPPMANLRRALSGASELFMQPRIVTGLFGLTADQLAHPDYRRAFGASLNGHEAHHQQAMGLPVLMVEVMTATMEVLEYSLEEAWDNGSNRAELRQEVSEALRRSLLMEALSNALAQRAAGEAPSWMNRYTMARNELGSRRGRVAALMLSMIHGGNRLGIEDADLPLYFRVDGGGEVGRFSVVSDYFLAQSGGLATSAVDQAEGHLASARSAYLRMRDGMVQDRNHVVNDEAQRLATAQKYGEPIMGICGTRDSIHRPDDPADTSPLRSEEAVEWAANMEDARACFLDQANADCALDPQLLVDETTTEDLQVQVCRGVLLHHFYGDSVRYVDEASHALVGRAYDAVKVAGQSGEAQVQAMIAAEAEASDEARRGFHAGLRGRDLIGVDEAVYIEDVCTLNFHGGRLELPTYATMTDGPLQRDECLRGALGETMFELRQARSAVAAAKASVDEVVAAYDIAMNSCALANTLGEDQEAIQREHHAVMGQLRAARYAADSVAAMADTDVGWAEIIAPWQIGFNVANSAANVASLTLTVAMEAAETAHDMAMVQLENYYSTMICYNDARLHLVGLRTAKQNLLGQFEAIGRIRHRQREMVAHLQSLVEEGQTAVARSEGWAKPPVGHDHWMDEDIDDYLQAMRRARRVTYLAVRAVEYEYQMTLDQRSAVFAAVDSGDLRNVLAELRSVVQNQSVGGNRPENYRAIFSLKTHLLQLASRENFPETEYRFNDQQRFRALVNAQRFAVYGDDGAYLGQRIPFRVTPFEQQSGEGEFALPVVNASRDCAERLWGVNVSIDGVDVVPEAAAQRSARIELMQRNAFFSRWCGDGAEGPYQHHTVRPEHNLLRDPIAGSPQGASQPRVDRFPGWTRARVDARLNVSAEAFNAEGNTENESTELAARGLYGEYALFFPAQSLAGPSAEGLDLRKLDDVRLRFDFVSVAR